MASFMIVLMLTWLLLPMYGEPFVMSAWRTGTKRITAYGRASSRATEQTND